MDLAYRYSRGVEGPPGGRGYGIVATGIKPIHLRPRDDATWSPSQQLRTMDGCVLSIFCERRNRINRWESMRRQHKNVRQDGWPSPLLRRES